MKLNMSVSGASGLELDIPDGTMKRRKPAGSVGRVRQKFPLCEDSGKRRLSKHAAEMHLRAAEVLRNRPGPHLPAWTVKRAYPCKHCGDWHLTSKGKR